MSTVYTFEGCALVPALRSLRRNGVEVQLQPKVFDLLLLLIRYRDQVLTKAELNAALWPRTRVSEAALTRLVKEARKAIGDDGEKQALVRTIQRKGYRFVAKVQIEDASTGLEHTVVRTSSATTETSPIDAIQSALRIIATLEDHRHDDAPRLCEALLTLAMEQKKHGLGHVEPAVIERALRVAREHALWEPFARVLLLREFALEEPEGAREQLETAIAHVNESSLRTRLKARLALLYAEDPCRFEAGLLRDDVLAGLDTLPVRDQLRVLSARHDWLWQGLLPEDRLNFVDRLLEGALAREDREAELEARLLRVDELLCRGKRALYDAERANMLALMQTTARPEVYMSMLRLDTARAIAAGEFARADALLIEAIETRGALPLDVLWHEHSVQRTSLLAAREKLDDVAPVSQRRDGERSSLSARCVQLWLSACTAEHAQARLELRRLLPAGDLTRLHPADAAIVAASCALLAEPSPAPMLRKALLPHRGRNLLRGRLVCYGPCDYFLGVLSVLEGDLDGARAWFKSATELAIASDLTLSLIRIRLHAAELFETRAEQIATLHAALSSAHKLELSQMTTHLRARLQELGALDDPD